MPQACYVTIANKYRFVRDANSIPDFYVTIFEYHTACNFTTSKGTTDDNPIKTIFTGITLDGAVS